MNVALYSLPHAEEVSGIALINNVAPLLWSSVGIYGLAGDPCFDTIWKVLPVLVECRNQSRSDHLALHRV